MSTGTKLPKGPKVRRVSPATWWPALTFTPRWLRVVVAVALVLDVLVLSGDVFAYVNRRGVPILPGVFAPWLDASEDGSVAELYGHLQLLAAIVALVLVWRATRVGVYAAWALAFAALVADDFFQIHERVGEMLVDTFSLPAVAGLRPQDLGELVVWAAAGIVVGGLLVVTHLRAGPRHRSDSWLLAASAAVLALFAVALDMVDAVVKRMTGQGTLTSLLDYAESAGELLTMTLMLFVALAIWVRQRSDP
ncbi:MAG TPA: hypothetical protein VEX88_07955 [Glaciibacter sp.]|nr:hypothetical protein [Glaciibacter sp.]